MRHAFVLIGLALPLLAAPADDLKSAAPAARSNAVPPVLRPTEDGDTRIVRLPGKLPEARKTAPAENAAAPAPASAKPAAGASPAVPTRPQLETRPATAAAIANPAVETRPALPPGVKARPAAFPAVAKSRPERMPVKARTGKPSPAPVAGKPAGPAPAVKPVSALRKQNWPPEFKKDSADYFRQRLGQVSETDAKSLLGSATRERPSVRADAKEDGRILAFNDPTGRFRSLELDFAAKGGKLRAVFAYPKELSWEKCRKFLGANAIEAPARNGARFFSYSRKRVDVLVSANGDVVSLGMY